MDGIGGGAAPRPQSASSCVILVHFDPDGQDASAVTVEHGVTEVQLADLVHPEGADGAERHQCCVSQMLEGDERESEDGFKDGGVDSQFVLLGRS